MARIGAQMAAQQGGPSPTPKCQGKQPQGGIHPHPSTIAEASSQQVALLAIAQSGGRKRKQPVEDALESSPDPDQKRQRISHTRPAAETLGELANSTCDPSIGTGAPQRVDPIAFWAKEGRWPAEQCWPEEALGGDSTIDRLLARKIFSNLSRKRSNSTISMTPSDQRTREEKTGPYRNALYPLLLETKGSYMGKSPLGIADDSRRICETLLNSEQPVPRASLFDDDIFERVCDNLLNKNEARVIQDVSRLIVPSAEQYALRAKHLEYLIESVNEGWNNAIPLAGTRPQPDYSVGFRREAFTDSQLTKIAPIIGDFIAGDQSFFMATYYMYFPFLTCEVKCGAAALDIADRQNAHSMTLAVRAIVELFRVVKREDEINRKILAFSVSHDHKSVRIYGHYPVIIGEDTKYYRHPIYAFTFTTLGGKDKWTAHRFTKNIYDIWMPTHFKNICSAIDQLPSDLDFGVPVLAEKTGLSQDLGHLMQSDSGSALLPIEQESQSSNTERSTVTQDTLIPRPEMTKRRKGD